MKIDKAKFLDAVKNFTDSTSYGLFTKRYDIDLVQETEFIKEKADLFEFSEIIPVFDQSISGWYNWSIKAMLFGKFALQSSIDFVPEDKSIEGDFGVSENNDVLEVVYGNLVVTGNVEAEDKKLLVIGDLHVKGNWKDEYSSIAVAGNLVVNGVLLTKGFLSVGGKLEAKLTYFDFNQGFSAIMGGCKAKVLIEQDHGGTTIFGKVEADYLEYDELRTEEPVESNRTLLLSNVEKIFTPEFVADLSKKNEEIEEADEDDEDEIEEMKWDNFTEVVFDYFEEKKTLLQSN